MVDLGQNLQTLGIEYLGEHLLPRLFCSLWAHGYEALTHVHKAIILQ